MSNRIGVTLLIFFVLLAVVPLTLVGILALNVAENQARLQLASQLQTVADIKSVELQRWFDDARTTLGQTFVDEIQRERMFNVLSQDRDWSRTLVQLNNYIRVALAAQFTYTELFVYNLKGDVLVGTEATRVGTNISSAPYFSPSLSADYVQPPEISADQAAVTIFITMPLKLEDGQIVGVLAGVPNLEGMRGVFARNPGLGDTGEAYLVTDKGNLLTPSRFEGHPLLQTVQSTGIQEALSGNTNSSGYQNYRGREVFGRYQPVSFLKGALMVEIEADEAFRTLRNGQILLLLATILSTLLAIGVGTGITLWITNPIRHLTEVTQRVRGGDYSQRANVQRKNELGELGISFNQMTAQLQSLITGLEERIAARTRDLAIAAEVSKDITTELNIENLLARVTELTAQRFDLYLCSVFRFDEETENLSRAATSDRKGKQVSFLESVKLPLDAEPSLIALAARTRQTVNQGNVKASATYMPVRDYPNTQSELTIPMILGNRLLGVFDLQSDAVDHFKPDDVKVLTTLAEQVAIAIRNAQLFTEAQVAQKLAERANQVKSQFLANVSHELRTPLNAILNFTQFVSSGMLGDVNDEQIDALNKAFTSGEHLLSLINDVLDISKIEAGALELFIEEGIQLSEEVEFVGDTATSLLKNKPVQWKVEIDPNLPPITGDRQRITQILLNLVSNACKFTSTGSVTLKAVWQAPNVLISVKDTGPGIPLEEQNLIFAPFQQAKLGLKHGGGTGLGLVISRRLAEAHGGRLWVESAAGLGATFFVELPVVGNPVPVTKEA